jgi:hypothetical protein
MKEFSIELEVDGNNSQIPVTRGFGYRTYRFLTGCAFSFIRTEYAVVALQRCFPKCPNLRIRGRAFHCVFVYRAQSTCNCVSIHIIECLSPAFLPLINKSEFICLLLKIQC